MPAGRRVVAVAPAPPVPAIIPQPRMCRACTTDRLLPSPSRLKQKCNHCNRRVLIQNLIEAIFGFFGNPMAGLRAKYLNSVYTITNHSWASFAITIHNSSHFFRVINERVYQSESSTCKQQLVLLLLNIHCNTVSEIMCSTSSTDFQHATRIHTQDNKFNADISY